MQSRAWKFAVAVTALIASHALAQAPQSTTPVKPMAADAHPSFAVATIKPHDPNYPRRQGWNFGGDRVSIQNQSVATMMMFAYSIDPHQIVDAPDWALRDRWDVEGTTDTPGEPNLHQMQEMIQKALSDRFGLVFHREKRPLSVYAIQIAKGGPKLTPAAHPEREAGQRANGQGTEMTAIYSSATIQDFILGEQFFLDRPLIDQTGLTRKYDITLRYTHDEANATDPNAPPGLFTAIQEQLGLKLTPIKAPIDVFVVDHVARPSAN